jgi:hypothetical protein
MRESRRGASREPQADKSSYGGPVASLSHRRIVRSLPGIRVVCRVRAPAPPSYPTGIRGTLEQS